MAYLICREEFGMILRDARLLSNLSCCLIPITSKHDGSLYPQTLQLFDGFTCIILQLVGNEYVSSVLSVDSYMHCSTRMVYTKLTCMGLDAECCHHFVVPHTDCLAIDNSRDTLSCNLLGVSYHATVSLIGIRIT